MLAIARCEILYAISFLLFGRDSHIPTVSSIPSYRPLWEFSFWRSIWTRSYTCDEEAPWSFWMLSSSGPKLTAPFLGSKRKIFRIDIIYISLYCIFIFPNKIDIYGLSNSIWIGNLLGDNDNSLLSVASTKLVVVAKSITIMARKGFSFDSNMDGEDLLEVFGGMLLWLSCIFVVLGEDGFGLVNLGGGFIRRVPFISLTFV